MKSIKSIIEEIADVQPMTGNVGQIFTLTSKKLPKFRLIDPTIDGLPASPQGSITIEVDLTVSEWVQQQPLYMWHWADVPAYSPAHDRYIISDELYTWLTVRWT